MSYFAGSSQSDEKVGTMENVNGADADLFMSHLDEINEILIAQNEAIKKDDFKALNALHDRLNEIIQAIQSSPIQKMDKDSELLQRTRDMQTLLLNRNLENEQLLSGRMEEIKSALRKVRVRQNLQHEYGKDQTKRSTAFIDIKK